MTPEELIASWHSDLARFSEQRGILQDRIRDTLAALRAYREVVGSYRVPPSVAIPFVHWTKDDLVPYVGCNCDTCVDARLVNDRATTEAGARTGAAALPHMRLWVAYGGAGGEIGGD